MRGAGDEDDHTRVCALKHLSTLVTVPAAAASLAAAAGDWTRCGVDVRLGLCYSARRTSHVGCRLSSDGERTSRRACMAS